MFFWTLGNNFGWGYFRKFYTIANIHQHRLLLLVLEFFMILLNVVHPPAGGNPIMVIIGSVSYDYLLFPIISGCFIIILIAIIVNKFLLKKLSLKIIL